MLALRRIAVVVAVAMFVLLPLHELVDIGEQWPYDGHVVLVLLSAIFLAGLAAVCRGVARACLVSLRKVLRPPSGTTVVFKPFAPCPTRPFLFLILCLLRI
jgi:hypothetical protein